MSRRMQQCCTWSHAIDVDKVLDDDRRPAFMSDSCAILSDMLKEHFGRLEGQLVEIKEQLLCCTVQEERKVQVPASCSTAFDVFSHATLVADDSPPRVPVVSTLSHIGSFASSPADVPAAPSPIAPVSEDAGKRMSLLQTWRRSVLSQAVPAERRPSVHFQVGSAEGRSSTSIRSSPTTISKETGRSGRAKTTIGMVVDRKDNMKKKRKLFGDSDDVKERVRKNLEELTNTVESKYKKRGVCQAIARSSWFDCLTLLVVFVNSVWLAVDTDRNASEVLVESDNVFIVMENVFCLYYFIEIIIRFQAFVRKSDCLRTTWFLFDLMLVVTSILETWVMTLVFVVTDISSSGAWTDTGILQLMRLLRLTRLARMARLVRSAPELVIIIRALAIATRSILATILLLFVVVYAFGILVTQLSRGTSLEDDTSGDTEFSSVIKSMNTLMLISIFPEQRDLMDKVREVGIIQWLCLFLFFIMSSIALMNLMVGVMAEVVHVVSRMEQEQLDMINVRGQLLSQFKGRGDLQTDFLISQEEYEEWIKEPQVKKMVKSLGTEDRDLRAFLFADRQRIQFTELMEALLDLRGSNQAKVKDIVSLRKSMITEFLGCEELVCEALALRHGEEGADEADALITRRLTNVRSSQASRADAKTMSNVV